MSLEVIHLRKALKFCMLDDELAERALRREAYEDRRRLASPGEGGGDFYGPFWSDAKAHAVDGEDLEVSTSLRIESHGGRRRLYSVLCPQFMEWWRQFESRMNEPILPLNESVHARHDFEELGVTLKVDNLLSFQIDRDRHRLIYPYFSEEPPLSPTWARVGIWAMSHVLTNFRVQDMVILDVQRGRSFSVREIDLEGDEEEIFLTRINELSHIWEQISTEVS